MGMAFYNTSFASCPPVSGLTAANQPNDTECDTYNRQILAFADQAESDIVILAGRWPAYYEGSRFDNGEGGVEPGIPIDVDIIGQPAFSRKEAVLSRYVDGINEALQNGKYVILIYPIPEAGWDVPAFLSRQLIRGAGAATLSTSYARFLERNADIIKTFDSIENPNLFRVRPHEILCDTFLKGRCANSVDGNVLYYDDNHLNTHGAALITPAIVEAIRRRETVAPR
jgi:hypothetical protein